MTNKLINKIALVTGGTSGIGLATAHRFAAEGAHVIVTGRRQEELDNAVAAIGHGAVGFKVDSSNVAALDGLYAQIKERFGRLDVVFANAGGGSMLPLGEITEENMWTISWAATSRAPGSSTGCLPRLARCANGQAGNSDSRQMRPTDLPGEFAGPG